MKGESLVMISARWNKRATWLVITRPGLAKGGKKNPRKSVAEGERKALCKLGQRLYRFGTQTFMKPLELIGKKKI